MLTTIIETNVRLTSQDLKKIKLETVLKEKLDDMYLKKFTKQYGYVLEILDFDYSSDNILSRINQDVFVKCNVKVISIIPEIDKVYYGIVKFIYPQGIFIKLLNIFDTLIPFEYLNKLGYSFNNGSFVNQETKDIITKESTVNVSVVDIKYDNKTFNCIAKLHQFAVDK